MNVDQLLDLMEETLEEGTAVPFAAARRVHVDDVRVERRYHARRRRHRVGNVMQFQVEEDLVSARLYVADDLRTFRIEQLHSDFYKGLFPLEFVQKRQCFRSVFKI